MMVKLGTPHGGWASLLRPLMVIGVGSTTHMYGRGPGACAQGVPGAGVGDRLIIPPALTPPVCGSTTSSSHWVNNGAGNHYQEAWSLHHDIATSHKALQKLRFSWVSVLDPVPLTNHHMGPLMRWARLTHTHRPSICIPTGWNRNAVILTEHCPAIDVSRLPPVFTFDKCLSFGSHPPSSWGLLYRDNLLFHCHSVRCLKRIIGRYFCSLDVKK